MILGVGWLCRQVAANLRDEEEQTRPKEWARKHQQDLLSGFALILDGNQVGALDILGLRVRWRSRSAHEPTGKPNEAAQMSVQGQAEQPDERTGDNETVGQQDIGQQGIVLLQGSFG